MLVTLKYNNKTYRLLYEDKCAYWLDELGESEDFKNILLDMCSIKSICMVCQDNNNKVGKYMSCCDYKQFMCVDCLSQLYELKMYKCPSCRNPFINDLLINIQCRSKYNKYLHLQNHIITKTDYGVNIYELNSLEESISFFDEEYEEYEYYKNIYYKGTKKQQLRHEKQYKFRNQRNRIKHENNCKFTKIKKALNCSK
jgi:hypothetical protein